MLRRGVAIVLIAGIGVSLSPSKINAMEIIYDSPEDLKETAPILIALNSTPQTEGQGITEAKEETKTEAAAPPVKMTPEQQAIQRFEELRAEIGSNPANLDIYFEYAQLAASLGKNEEAESSYKYMLDQDPSLERVKLELGLLYMRMGKLKQSKVLFTEVLSKNPPDAVQANIGKVMAVVDYGLKPDKFSGSLSTGYNIDTNANSAASSGQTTFNNTSLPLSAGSNASRDGHFYTSASLTHNHMFDIDSDFFKLSYETTGVLYRTHQDTETSLDIGLVSIKTGPIFELPDLKTKLGLNVSESMIELDGNRYLKTRSWESNASYAVMDNLLVNGAYSYEYRNFINTLTATTYTDRSGNANQEVLGITYALTPLDIFNATATWRYENAENDIYGTTQASITGSYTRVLPWDLTFNTVLGLKKVNYHEPDPVVSDTILRHDRERSMTYTLAKRLPYNITASVAYQYKNVDSNIQNNKYHNNRYSFALGWGF